MTVRAEGAAVTAKSTPRGPSQMVSSASVGARKSARDGVGIDVEGLARTAPGGALVLQGVTFAVQPGELVAIVGGSGTGKTTLLEALAGVHPADAGCVRFDGIDAAAHLSDFRAALGYVPQDDIIHAELTLRRTLTYAAELRLAGATADEIDAAVDQALAALELADRAELRVSALSGGQRKRASIAVEYLAQPHVFCLDEPTSGLDPATSAELLRVLRGLSDDGATIVFTTHALQDLDACDRIVFLAPGGRLAFHGTLAEARTFFGVDSIAAIYTELATDSSADGWVTLFREHRPPQIPAARVSAEQSRLWEHRARVGPWRQFSILTRRTFETLTRNRLTLAILLGSPVMVVAMFAVLFRSGAFDPTLPNPSAIVMIVFWITFGSFFFGLTYGLLQIVTEQAIVRREHLVGLRLTSYLFSKLAVLLPFLLVVNGLMIVVLRGLDRLPAASATTYLSIGVTLALEATAALSLGLLTSAAVRSPSQATLALPMLCFPAVLFSGAILPVHVMANVGAWFSNVIPVRWAFEALSHDLGVRTILLHGHSPLGPPLVASYGSAGMHSTGTYWAVLLAFSAVFLAGAWAALARACRRNER